MRRLVVLLLLLVPTVALAQARNFEITPFVSYRWGGEIRAEDIDLFQFDVQVRDSDAYGLALDFPVTRSLQVELLANRQSTQLVEDHHLFSPAESLADIDLTYYHVGLLYQWNAGRISPYIVGSLGISVLDVNVPQVRDETELSGSLGGGFKLYMAPNVGLRVEARGFWTNISHDDHWDWGDCAHHDDCWSGDWHNLAQSQVSVGLLIGF